ncbi:MAG: hypothetical protein Q9168_007814, partial [Polycauliona sp. 1 TL-2023]
MEIDTHRTFGEIYEMEGAAFTKELFEISKHTVPQAKTRVWADNLRFITVPDTGFAQTIDSKQEGQDCVCESRPAFEDIQYDNLAITDYGQIKGCVHYVAVSYCWRTSEDTSDGRKSYDIWTSQGPRAGRAPRQILDRAIKFAASRNLKLIWIDQECIDQDNREDKELGIQSMDAVYIRSRYPLGLLTCIVPSQRHIDVLALAIARRNIEGSRKGIGLDSTTMLEIQAPFTAIELESLLEILQVMAKDRWLKRAWILQETVLSGNNMTLLISCDPKLNTSTFGGIPGEAQLKVTDTIGLRNSIAQVYADSRSKIAANVENGEILLDQIIEAAKHVVPQLTQHWGKYSGKTHAQNAIEPIHYLEFYANSRVPDRLAIIGNLCDYSIRLDTRVVEPQRYKFSTCILAMALLNGDISLLQFWQEVSQRTELAMYHWLRSSTNTPRLIGPSRAWPTFSWAPSAAAGITSLPQYKFQTDPTSKFTVFSTPPLRLAAVSLRKTGLAMHGWIWDISSKIEMSEIAEEFRESWDTLTLNPAATMQSWSQSTLFILRVLQTCAAQSLWPVLELLWRAALLRPDGHYYSRLHSRLVDATHVTLQSLYNPSTQQFNSFERIAAVDFIGILQDALSAQVSIWPALLAEIMM